jgi:predicted esterase
MKLPKLKAIWLWLLLGGVSPTSMSAAIDTDSGSHSPSTVDVTIAEVPMLVAVPRRVTKSTPLIIMYHGFGPPNSPELLAQSLPPIANALTVYPSLPLVGKRMPVGGVDELLRRQNKDYIGQLLYPSILAAADELPQIISAVSKRYGLSKSAPVILFGFSAGGAAVLLSLTESEVRPRAVVVVNAPLSITQAVDSYERQSKSVYAWSESGKNASRYYDLQRNAGRIADLHPKLAILLLESERDAGPTVEAAQSAALALRSAALRYRPDPDISAKVLPGADHYVFAGAESAIAKRTIMSWIEHHAFL